MIVERNGRYQVRVDDVTGPNGKRKRVTKGTYAKLKDAQKAERDALSARDRGVPLATNLITLEKLYARFMQARAHEHSPTTVYGYEAAWKRCAPIANVAVAKLQVAQLADLYAALSVSGRFDGGPLPTKSVRHTAGLVHALLEWALDLEIVTRNVADVRAAMPTRGVQKRVKAYNGNEAPALIQEASETRYGPLIVVAFTTGLRRGELAGLKWSDIDFERSLATISRAVVKLPSKVPFVKSTKTGSVASISLSAKAIEALNLQRATQVKYKNTAGAMFDDQGFVFAGPFGGVPSPDAMSHAVRRIAARVGTSVRGVHAMRHSTASWMLRAGADVRTVQAVLRHSAASTTLNTYAHEIEGAQASAVAHVDHYLEIVPKPAEDWLATAQLPGIENTA